jgi:hypothetical protein
MDESIPGNTPKQQAVYAILKEIQHSRDDTPIHLQVQQVGQQDQRHEHHEHHIADGTDDVG